MTETDPHPWNESEAAEIRQALARIFASAPFQQAPRRQRFLEYIVEEALLGRADQLKGYAIGLHVFDKPASFDPITDPIVRVEAARLRDKLREFYETEGRVDSVRIEIPKGTYAPCIEFVAPSPDDGERLPAARTPAEMGWLERPALSGAVAFAMLMVFFAGWTAWRSTSFFSHAAPAKLSLAVMPFDTISDDPAWTRLADGMTQDITTDLSQSKDLLVVARNSTDGYRGKPADVREVGRELDVRYLLQGVVQPGDGRVKISVQLVDTRSAENVWSMRYNRPAADIFAVQGEVTEQIAATLAGYEGAVAQAERKLIRRKPPSVLTAYDHYLLGVEAKHGGASQGVSKEGLDEAEREFLKALEIDPQLARAYVGLSYVYEYRLDLNIGVPSENLGRLVEVATNAARLDPNDGEAQMVLGHAYAYQGLRDQALQQFAKAEALAPSNADVLILTAWYLPQLDETTRAMALAERALRLNPNYPAWYNQGLRYVYFFGGDFAKAVKFVKLVPNPNPLDSAYLAMASAMLDDRAASEAAAAELRRRDPMWNAEAYLSDNGGVPERLANMFLRAARKANIPACAGADRASDSAFVRLAECDAERQKSRGEASLREH